MTLASGLDAVTQVIEPYLSSRANPLTDALCRDAIPRGLAALARLMRDEDAEDACARDDLAFVSLCGGLALANAGLGAVHGLAGVIGGVCGAPHGAICGRLLPGVLRANRAAVAAAGRDGTRFAEVAAWIAAALGPGSDDPFDRLAARIDAWGLPRLGALGVPATGLRAIAEAAQGASSMKGNVVTLGAEALSAVMADAT